MKRTIVYAIVMAMCLLSWMFTATPTTDAAIDRDTIMGIWLLDEGLGDTAKDSSGNGNDGEIVGAQWTDGKEGQALEFDGASHVAIAASQTTDDIFDGFTYLLWMQPTAPAPNANTRVLERDWHNPTIQIGNSDFYGSISVNADQANTNVRGGTWVAGEWSFVALTHDGANLKLYVNDEMVAEKDVGTPDTNLNASANGAVWLGSWKAAGWDYIGIIDEVGIFNVPLDENELASIRENGLAAASAVSQTGKLAVTWGTLKIDQ